MNKDGKDFFTNLILHEYKSLIWHLKKIDN